MKDFPYLREKGLSLALKIYALQIMVAFALGFTPGIIGPMLPSYVGRAFVIISGFIFVLPVAAFAGEHVKSTGSPKIDRGMIFLHKHIKPVPKESYS